MSVREDIRACTSCSLHTQCTSPVPYRGRRSEILVLGEAPGAQEDEEGRPFVGPAGQKLWDELERVNIWANEVFACNVVSCYPNGTPTPGQIQACRGNLYRQVRLCFPRYILALGKTAANALLETDRPMGILHGTWFPLFWFDGKSMFVFVSYHPAAVLRDRTLTRVFRQDLAAFADIALEEDGYVQLEPLSGKGR